MKNKLFTRIFLSFIIVALLLSALIGIFSSGSVRSHYLKTETASLREFIQVVKPTVETYINSGDFAGLENLLKKMSTQTDIRFTIININGKVLADSERNPAEMDNHINRPEVRGALEGRESTSTRYSNTIGEDMLYFAHPFADGKGGIKYVIRGSMPLSDIKTLSNSLTKDILKSMMFILLISIILAYFYSKRIFEPIKELAEASKKVAAHDFNVRVSVRERDEIWELAESFNFMTLQIKELFGSLSEKQKQLDAVIESVAEGLVVVDDKGRIVLVNKSFRKIAGSDVKEGNFYWESFMPVKFNDAIEQGLKNRKYFVEQIGINDRVYLCSATFLEEKKQAAFVLYDITEFKDLERIKKDFVANVSHELRTPLTAIKGFAETLEEDAKDPEAKRYLEIIKKNTERLINIVTDLLTLSQLEETEKPETGGRADLHTILTNAAKVFEQQIKQKKLELKLDIQNNLPEIKGDAFRLEQVFINLIDNAVKYTEAGSVIISAKAEGGDVVISVSDTGSGIPAQHLQRIFERFYVVDKSRSRKLGGTGLGLSIVKHIVLLHNGRITAESEKGKGTKFTVILPQ
jgi:two-component system, OmpR family, phosphate regulon sensor histidine kinase PhoR